MLKGHHFTGQASSSIPVEARPILTSIEEEILDLLEREAMGIDELSRELEMPVSELSVKLSMMQIKGLIEMRGNKYYNVK